MEMWKYIVTWCLLTIGTDATYQEVVDQFGRKTTRVEEYEYIMNSDCNHRREFFSRDSAYKFYYDAHNSPATFNIWGEIKIDDVKIDSVQY